MKIRIPLVAAFLIVGVIHAPAATITVTSTADNGPGSLRAALASAASGDTIDASGISGTILLTSGELLVSNSVSIVGPGPANLAVNGNFPNTTNRVFHIGPNTVVSISALTVTNGLAPGLSIITTEGGGIYNDHAALTISNCTLSGNSAYVGSGIYNNGLSGSASLTILNSTLSGNFGGGGGGGIENEGDDGGATLTILNSTLSGNSAGEYGYGGGIENDGSGTLTVSNSTLTANSGGSGGGIYNDGSASVTIDSSTLSFNSVTLEAGGGIYNHSEYGGGPLTITNSTISGNVAINQTGGDFSGGGGIMNFYGTVVIASSTISGNSAQSAAYGENVAIAGGGVNNLGMMTIINSTISNNSAFGKYGDYLYIYGAGAGIFNGGTLTVTNSTVSDNFSSDDGGGIYNGDDYGSIATLSIVNSTISSNTANYDSGGGIFNNGYNGPATISMSASTVSGNSAPSGGGIDNEGGEYGSARLTVSNCTVSANSAGYDGGGIENDDGTLTISESTLSGNSAPSGGGIETGDGTVLIANSTLSTNSSVNDAGIINYGTALKIGSTILKRGASGGTITNVLGTVTSLGYNLSSDDGGGFLTTTGDQINTDPMLGPLQDNGGPTFTHALLCGSPAIDKGYNFSGSATDQRGVGFARTVDDPTVANAPGGDGTDIGAFEVQQGVCAPLDSDGDGVPDSVDLCPDTTSGAIVNTSGCSIAQLVPCAGPLSGGRWKNHGEYVSSVAKVADQFLQSGLITGAEKGAIVSRAAQSGCGK